MRASVYKCLSIWSASGMSRSAYVADPYQHGPSSSWMDAHVLVIEDDPDVREALVEVLQTELPWVTVSSASDGLEALEVLEEGPEPCLALLDVMMPVMNGIEFLDALRERHLAPGMQVVLVSAHVRIARHVDYPRITGLLPKPFTVPDLLAIVRRHCSVPSTEARQP
jgi:CheY-like chemotaxis protein